MTGRRANFEELIWDADGGFAPEWIGRSSISGSGPYTMLLQRSSFSAAGLALFSYDALGGSGGTLAGDVTGPPGSNTVVAIQNLPVAAPTTPLEVLTFDGTDLNWTIPAGTGDVVGPASSVADRVAVFNGTTGKLIQDGGKTIAQVEASAVSTAATAVGVRPVVAAYHGHSDTSVTAAATTSWTDITNTCTLVDDIASSISRSGSAFTFSKAGTYRAAINVNFTMESAGNAGIRLRDTSGGVTKLIHTPYLSQPTLLLTGVFSVTAGQVLYLQTVRTNSGATFGIATIDGEPSRNVNIAFDWIGT